MILAAGAVFFKRYGSSNEKADKEQYYGIENSDDLALIINNEVVKKKRVPRNLLPILLQIVLYRVRFLMDNIM